MPSSRRLPLPVARVLHRTREAALRRLREALLPEEVVRHPGALLEFDEHSYVAPTLLQFGHEPEPGRVTVGRYSSVNGGTRVLTGGHHHPEWVSTYPFRIREGLPGAYTDGQPYSRGPVRIGSDVWIGYDVVVLSGVTIGHGAVVGTGSLVTRDIPPYAVATGNPATVRRARFDDDTVAALLRIAWWEWPHELVVERVDELCSPDVEAFARRYDPGPDAAGGR